MRKATSGHISKEKNELIQVYMFFLGVCVAFGYFWLVGLCFFFGGGFICCGGLESLFFYFFIFLEKYY